jgi:tetratricopeptide (TPR) repeat protein
LSRPFRYTFILVLVALGTCLAAVSGWRYARASAPVNGPIILISVDAVRADHLPAYGYERVKTPAIDMLARDGVVFERGFSHVPQTFPAYASLLTGRLPFDTGVRDAVGFPLPAGERLLPEMLRDRGYATAGVVSSFLLRKETGINQGFSFFDANIPAGEGPLGGVRRDSDATERIAEHWLDTVGTSRAFLFLHLDGPTAPDPRTRSAGEVSAYDAAIANVDNAVGQLLRYLKTHQLYDQSTVILVSSHGEGLGDHGEEGHGLLVYDEALRVPLIIKPPAGEGAGRRVQIAVQHVDLVPTILDLAKAPIPGNLRGRSLTPLLDRDGIIANQPIYSESLFGRYHFGWADLTSLTDGRYRYIRAPKEELYDLDTDPDERHNLADIHPEMVATFRNRLKDLVSGAAAPRTMDVISAEDREHYEALGYVGIAPDAITPATEVADPTDQHAIVERYRAAVTLLAVDDFRGAIEQFKALVGREPGMRDVWMLLARSAWRAERPDVALDAYQHAIQLAPKKSDAYLGAAAALVQVRLVDQAVERAQHVADDPAADNAAQSNAHELLARIALLRRNVDLAREEAGLAEEADATRPVRAYVDGRIAFDRKHYGEALESFEAALMRLENRPHQSMADLRLYAAESLQHLDRLSEAEYLFLEELKEFPHSERARAGLTVVYKTQGRAAEAAGLAHQ